MARGDHLRVRRRGYWHHGIDCGDGTVIHYTGEPKRLADARVARTSIEAFAKGGEVRVVNPGLGDGEPDEIMRRAESRLGEARYGAIRNNCEHFARWCRDGFAKSRQVRRALVGAGALAAAGLVVLTVGVKALARRA